MELRHLRYFEALASTLSFTRAAERLHISQPPLSRQIQLLEQELGVALIDRSARPMALTRAGAFFYEQSVQILARVQEVTRATQRVGAGHRRWIGVGFTASMLYGAVPQVLQRFMTAHPDVDVVLSELTSLQQVEALQAGRIDIGFGRVAIEHETISNTLLAEEPLLAVLPAGSSLARRKSVSMHALAAQMLVVYPSQPRPGLADQILAQFRAHGCPVTRVYETNSLQTAIGLVATGIGVTLVPKSVQRLQRDDIRYRPLVERGVTSPLLMTTRAADASALLAEMCSAVRKAYGVRPG